MAERIEYRIQEESGRRYAVVPLEQFTALLERAGDAEALTLPHEVVRRCLVEDASPIRAWREYLGWTQTELAEALAVSQAQVAQWERSGARPRQATLKKIAEALGLHVSQLSLTAQSRARQCG